MDAPRRMPLQDLPLEQFLIAGIITGSKTPRKHKRPLSPSRITPLNPAKRRVLDAEGISSSNNPIIPPHPHPIPLIPSNMHAATPTRPSWLGHGLARNHAHSQGILSPLPLQRHLLSCELYAKPTAESSTDPQSRHYPGFDIFRDSGYRRDLFVPRVSSDGETLADRSEEDKENVPLRRKAKKFLSKKRLLTGRDSWDGSCLESPAQTSKVVHPERTPFSARRALR